jgi:subtilase family serine protease
MKDGALRFFTCGFVKLFEQRTHQFLTWSCNQSFEIRKLDTGFRSTSTLEENQNHPNSNKLAASRLYIVRAARYFCFITSVLSHTSWFLHALDTISYMNTVSSTETQWQFVRNHVYLFYRTLFTIVPFIVQYYCRYSFFFVWINVINNRGT